MNLVRAGEVNKIKTYYWEDWREENLLSGFFVPKKNFLKIFRRLTNVFLVLRPRKIDNLSKMVLTKINMKQ